MRLTDVFSAAIRRLSLRNAEKAGAQKQTLPQPTQTPPQFLPAQSASSTALPHTRAPVPAPVAGASGALAAPVLYGPRSADAVSSIANSATALVHSVVSSVALQQQQQQQQQPQQQQQHQQQQQQQMQMQPSGAPSVQSLLPVSQATAGVASDVNHPGVAADVSSGVTPAAAPPPQKAK
eukprot:Opistho-2@24268